MTFFGVRGSTPCSSPESRRYGGNTSCVVVEGRDCDPIIFDLGTGLRDYGESLVASVEPFNGLALVTHLHWDHVQGLPFFRAINRRGAALVIAGPSDDGRAIGEAFAHFMRPPYFPISVDQLAGQIEFRDISFETFSFGRAVVTSRPVPHVGSTNGYRVDIDGTSVAYVSDHQQPLHDAGHVDPLVLDLCRDVDVLIHDAQYSPEEFAERTTWGHCTIDYAFEVARQARAKCLVLFHHDPLHHDDWLDELTVPLTDKGAALGFDVVIAHEGMRLRVCATGRAELVPALHRH